MPQRKKPKGTLQVVNDRWVKHEEIRRGVALLFASDPLVMAHGEPVKLDRESDEEALRRTICGFCELLKIDVTAARRAQLERMDRTALESLKQHIAKTRAW